MVFSYIISGSRQDSREQRFLNLLLFQRNRFRNNWTGGGFGSLIGGDALDVDLGKGAFERGIRSVRQVKHPSALNVIGAMCVPKGSLPV